MANSQDIKSIFDILCSAGLRSTPSAQDIIRMIPVWARPLSEIPGNILEQAAWDVVAEDTFFPTVASLRARALKVKANNERSTANAWKSEEGDSKPPHKPHLTGTIAVTAKGWIPTTPPDTLPLPHAAYEEMYALLDEFSKIDDPTEAQIEALEAALKQYQGVMA